MKKKHYTRDDMDKLSEIIMNLEEALWVIEDIKIPNDDLQSAKEFCQSSRDLILTIMSDVHKKNKEEARIRSMPKQK